MTYLFIYISLYIYLYIYIYSCGVGIINGKSQLGKKIHIDEASSWNNELKLFGRQIRRVIVNPDKAIIQRFEGMYADKMTYFNIRYETLKMLFECSEE